MSFPGQSWSARVLYPILSGGAAERLEYMKNKENIMKDNQIIAKINMNVIISSLVSIGLVDKLGMSFLKKASKKIGE